MPLNLASPGILVREVDLTIGRVDATTDKLGGIVGPFARGPVEVVTRVSNENELLDNFGQPYETDRQYETWLTASSYLAYGGQLNVIRADDTTIRNAFVGSGNAPKIKSVDHYDELGYDENAIPTTTIAARDPGSWANGIRVAIIDGKADQTLTVTSTTGVTVGAAITQTVSNASDGKGIVISSKTSIGKTEALDGYFKGIVTEIDTTNNKLGVKFLSRVSAAGTNTVEDYNNTYKFAAGAVQFPSSGAGTTSAVVTRGEYGSTAGTYTVAGVVTSFYKNAAKVLDMQGGIQLSDSATTLGINTSGIDVGATKFLAIGNEIISLSGASIGVGELTSVTRNSEGTSAAAHNDGVAITVLTKNAGVGTITETVDSDDTTIGITTSADISGKVNAGGILRLGSELVKVGTFLNGDTANTDITASVDWFDQQYVNISSASIGGTETVNKV